MDLYIFSQKFWSFYVGISVYINKASKQARKKNLCPSTRSKSNRVLSSIVIKFYLEKQTQ